MRGRDEKSKELMNKTKYLFLRIPIGTLKNLRKFWRIHTLESCAYMDTHMEMESFNNLKLFSPNQCINSKSSQSKQDFFMKINNSKDNLEKIMLENNQTHLEKEN